MSDKVSLLGILPLVEYRSSLDRYFVTYPELNRELVMAFESKFSAREIAINTFCGTPYFTEIPTVPTGTPYPRPNREYPRLQDPGIKLVIIG